MEAKLTVYFEDPFWVGVFERMEDDKLSVAKVTFGAEPKDWDVLGYILTHYHELAFSEPVAHGERERADSPKRRQRAAAKQMQSTGVGTRSQQALQAQREMNKRERQVKSREQKLAEAERRFALKQQKKREKHRGR